MVSLFPAQIPVLCLQYRCQSHPRQSLSRLLERPVRAWAYLHSHLSCLLFLPVNSTPVCAGLTSTLLRILFHLLKLLRPKPTSLLSSIAAVACA